jgi:hypothetical protein
LGTGALHAGNLTWLAILGAVHTGKNFANVLGLTLKLLSDAANAHDNPWNQEPLRHRRPPATAKTSKNKTTSPNTGTTSSATKARHKHDPHGRNPEDVTEEAFVQARRKLPWAFWVALLAVLSEQFEVDHGQQLRWQQFRLLALDGTTINLPNWKRLSEHFGTASNGKGSRATQARMVMLQFPQVRMPWRYELTPLAEGERTVAGRLLENLRANDLVLMDRGFFSYGLFQQITRQNAHFAIRQVAGVVFKTVRRLGPQERVVKWRPADRKWRKAGLPEDMELRVIDYQVRGFRSSALVTSVLDPQVISRDQWIDMATVNDAGEVLEGGLYHRRWEIETTFAELKVTQGMEGSLRGRTPASIRYEVAGHVLLYLLVRWLMVEAAEEHGISDARRLSFAEARRELEDLRVTLVCASPRRIRTVLLPRLWERIASHTVPFRPGRHYPRPHDTKYKDKGKGKGQKASKLTTAVNTKPQTKPKKNKKNKAKAA